MKRSLVIILILTTTASCMSQQGITGKVVWISGNQMPGPGNENKPAKPVQRELHIYKPTSLDQVKRLNGFYTDVQTEFVAKVVSNDKGAFTVALPPGEYSVFTKEPAGLFANMFDGHGRIHVIEVKPQNFTEITFQVNYEAAY